MSELISDELVLRKLATVFPDQEVAKEALKSLRFYSQSGPGISPQLVRLAILKLCDGNLYRLRELVQVAKRDPRDVIYPAQSPEYFEHVKLQGLDWGRRPKGRLSQAEHELIGRRDQSQWFAWLKS